MAEEERCPECGGLLKKDFERKSINNKWVVNNPGKACRKCDWDSKKAKDLNEDFEIDQNADEDDLNPLEDK